ncbi:hypothetical protein [Acetobacter ghanensis]|uniref:Burkholderia phage Bcep781 gp06 n=1 Tax=Acetobacter ghanensis TaxID=431306 RepID=A0A0U5BF84_9PROT|nr:hypothetical protein [Acetobacter ghanensis]NHO39840.1 hypothetical protein [Acetobacter ghanensis]GBQ49432.1 hypothetical protein AA18895_1629 [Acetobacter ghanensis DSM 18895]CEF53213.1 Burkholderia phage Bcep781 gp06 [Acetobacter ghanensis]
MRLFALAGRLSAAVNPSVAATLLASTGSVTNPDGTQTPTYTTLPLRVEVQALAGEDLQQVQSITQQADRRVVYVPAAARALNRPLQCGGDILQFYGSDWLITQSLEEWGEGAWSKVLVTRQSSPAV